ncbi:formate dehydrogenase accessory sulfurtransferase FdhD [Corynebacterium uropygiale]|uniref:Sulfur carrier protein FdhD n=1 Tax=Corynebacterium uropygiale TaxID=1775911 RepID=A0A9X1QN03_9CORY|nr:formate dehydrogenase accessory sulfurtransferase FdhD [Corynebacterium uropygiale]MCF4005921.1 formate dehydrogenase accessory sulfurtransferase FdhD [Corynebacterium uropygiale]
MTRLTKRVPTQRFSRRPSAAPGADDAWLRDQRADEVIVEEPLEIRSKGQVLATTMRTPGHDIDLVHGYLYTEGIIRSAEDIREARYCPGAVGPGGTNTYNVLDLDLARRSPVPVNFLRTNTTTSACGVCGSSSIEQIMAQRDGERVVPIHPAPDVLVSLPERLRAEQKSFRRTGGVHAAGVATTDGEILLVREDVGRHNAADKVVGALLRGGQLPASELLLVMTSRASFELVNKALSAGFSGLVAISAATSLAVEMARTSGLLLAGFTRGDRFNLYAGDIG